MDYLRRNKTMQMYQRKITVSLDCGLHLFREMLNGKWKMNLLFFIDEWIKRPGELRRKIPDTTRRVLDTQLNQLVAHGLLTKTVFAELPLKVEYELTGLGRTLMPIIKTIASWGEDNRPEIERRIRGGTSKEFAAAFANKK
jgi:DNA-binding HxlR family transcriptional regulator